MEGNTEMSEYQRYEFMTIDKPLTKAQLDAVENLSSHIKVSPTHALVEYNWGDFKYDPIKILYEYFDGFLYWANWGSPRFALRFPHGALPSDLIENYDYDEYVTFTQHPDYDILDIHFAEMEAPDEWTEYELGSLLPIRDELMDGDLRALYIAWLACQDRLGEYDEEDDDDEEEGDEEYDETAGAPPVPPGLGKPTAAQRALVELLRVPDELLVAAAQHSEAAKAKANDDFAIWVELLPEDRRKNYLVRLALNEPGLSRMLAKELRELGGGKANAASATGEKVAYSTLLAEGRVIREKREREERAAQEKMDRERREKEQLARQRHLQEVHARQEVYWGQVDKDVAKGSAAGYDDAVQVLVDLREAADQFKEKEKFLELFHTWIRSHLRRPALLKRLQERKFPLPEA
jgi:hypothetical protein